MTPTKIFIKQSEFDAFAQESEADTRLDPYGEFCILDLDNPTDVPYLLESEHLRIVNELNTEKAILRKYLRSTISALDHFHRSISEGHQIMPSYHELLEKANQVLNK